MPLSTTPLSHVVRIETFVQTMYYMFSWHYLIEDRRYLDKEQIGLDFRLSLLSIVQNHSNHACSS